MRCFGAQATLCGILLLTTNFDQQTYKIWTCSILPFFVFDLMAYQSGYLTAFGAIGDAVGNVVFTLAGLKGMGYIGN
jgi:hypothetical protein